jgi:hypothetical protein
MKRTCDVSTARWTKPCENEATIVRRDKAGRAVRLCEKCDREYGNMIGRREAAQVI